MFINSKSATARFMSCAALCVTTLVTAYTSAQDQLNLVKQEEERVITKNISSVSSLEVTVETGILECYTIIEDEIVPLTAEIGRIDGPSGEETYYNLNMKGCVRRMKRLGFEGEYWIREDGVKMFGDYIMVAADLSTRPLGTILESSLGQCIVVDTGDFVEDNPTQIDIAVTW